MPRHARSSACGARLSLAFLLASGACRGRSGDISATGTLEVVEVDVAPAVAARLSRVAVEEGDAVRAGDTIATFVQPAMGADIDQRRARLASAEAQWRDLERGARAPEILRAKDDLAAASAEAARTALVLERQSALGAAGAVSAQTVDNARTAASVAASRRDAARQALALLLDGARPERIRAARAEVEAARAALDALRATAADLVLLAPVAGVVLGRHAEPGELLTAGMPVATLGDLTHPWVRVYVNGLLLPRIRVGGRATAVLDGEPGTRFPGKVVAITDRAEFTPRVALTEEERADLMFGVKVALDDSTGALKPGLPVTVTFGGTSGAGESARARRP